MYASNREKGAVNETFICNLLIQQGYEIVCRNYFVYGIGEIDIICLKEDTIYFVEVRSTIKVMNDPAYSIKAFKFNRIKLCAANFLNNNPQYQLFGKQIIIASVIQKRYKRVIKFYKL